MRALVISFVVALAACASGNEQPAAPAPGSITARFPPDGARDIIQVTVLGRLPARAVELIGPNGLVAPAYTLDSEQASRTDSTYRNWGSRPSIVGGFGSGGFRGGGFDSSGYGTGMSLTFPIVILGAPSTTTTMDDTVTNAFVRIPDVIDYRLNWQAYRIRLELGTAPDLRVITIDAPAPT